MTPEDFRAIDFRIWPRALPRCRSPRGLQASCTRKSWRRSCGDRMSESPSSASITFITSAPCVPITQTRTYRRRSPPTSACDTNVSDPLTLYSEQRHKGENATLAIIVHPHRNRHVFDRGHYNEGPDDKRQRAERGARRRCFAGERKHRERRPSDVLAANLAGEDPILASKRILKLLWSFSLPELPGIPACRRGDG